jgi:hypothetical protein
MYTSPNKIDTKRIEYVKKIRLEYNFYNAFRKTVRILINEYKNLNMKMEINKIIENNVLVYTTKLQQVRAKIMDLVKDKIEFMDKIDIDAINELSPCLQYEKDTCEIKNPLCIFKNDTCVLFIPKFNLITNIDNEEMYFAKIADELIRYNHVKSFIMKNNYLSFDKIGYNLFNNEIIILQSLLTPEYFDKLTSTGVNKYLQNNTYDNTNPSNAFINDVPIEIDDIKQIKSEEEQIEMNIISAIFWRETFPSNCIEIEYPTNKTFEFMIEIIRRTKNIVLTEEIIRSNLLELYENYSEKYKTKIATILFDQGKKKYGKNLKKSDHTFKHVILDPGYYLTNFDIWLLVSSYEIPTIFISDPPILLLETKFNTHAFVAYKNSDSTEFVYINTPSVKSITRTYTVFINNNDDNIFIKLSELNESKTDGVLEIENAIRLYDNIENNKIEHFLNVYEAVDNTDYKPKKKGVQQNPFNVVFEIIEPPKPKEDTVKPKEDSTKQKEVKFVEKSEDYTKKITKKTTKKKEIVSKKEVDLTKYRKTKKNKKELEEEAK